MFFEVKTRRPEWTLRIIVSEWDTWQKSVALFLKEKLNVLDVNDPFLTKSSDDVMKFLKEESRNNFYTLSVDVKELYYSLPRKELLICVQKAIEAYAELKFINSVGISVGVLPEKHVLRMGWESVYTKACICIGSCIVPISILPARTENSN